MKYLGFKMAAAGLALSVAGPALAQDTAVDPATFTCGEFVALDADAQASAAATLKTSAMSSESSTDTSASVTGSSDAPAVDGSTDAGSTTGSSDTAASTTADASAMANPDVDTVKTACEGNDDMLAADAMAAN